MMKDFSIAFKRFLRPGKMGGKKEVKERGNGVVLATYDSPPRLR